MKSRTGYIEIWTKGKYTWNGIASLVGIYYHPYPITYREVIEFWIDKGDQRNVYCKMFKPI